MDETDRAPRVDHEPQQVALGAADDSHISGLDVPIVALDLLGVLRVGRIDVLLREGHQFTTFTVSTLVMM